MNESQPLSGRNAVVTGGTGGIGKATAAGLAALGRARRHRRPGSRTRLAAAAEDLARDGQRRGRRLRGRPLVAGAGAPTRRRLQERYPRIDVLVNNVGGFWAHRHVTADGLELTFAVNHLAPFLLTNLLVDRMRRRPRPGSSPSSPARRRSAGSTSRTSRASASYSGQRAYNQSKLANVLFTYELARRLRGTTVTANVVHPGVTRTAFGAEDQARFYAATGGMARPFMRSPERGADTVVWAASAPELDGVTGGYFHDRRPKRSSQRSHDETTAKRLWQVSEELVGLSW